MELLERILPSHLCRNSRILRCLAVAGILLPCFYAAAHAQRLSDTIPEPTPTIQMQVGKVLHNGDSIPHVIMPTLHKYPEREFKTPKEQQRYNRLVMNVKKTLPLARAARVIIVETYQLLEMIPDEKERIKHINDVEKGLKKQYMPQLKKLTRSQGKLLIKLIDRECNQSGYSIAKAFIGPFKANFYQALSFCFGLSLTKKYDPEGDDKFTERVVRMIESGQL